MKSSMEHLSYACPFDRLGQLRRPFCRILRQPSAPMRRFVIPRLTERAQRTAPTRQSRAPADAGSHTESGAGGSRNPRDGEEGEMRVHMDFLYAASSRAPVARKAFHHPKNAPRSEG